MIWQNTYMQNYLNRHVSNEYKNLFRITCTQVSYQILTCVRVFLWKERIHSHSIDCIKNFIQHVFMGIFE